MKYAILTGAVSLGLLAGLAQAQEGNRNEITVSAFAAFQHSANGNGITQSGDDQAGALATYRFLFSDHQGLEFNYSFSRYNQNFAGIGGTPLNLTSLGLTNTSFSVPTNTQEGTVSYVYRFGVFHHMRPFVTAGTGVLVFSPESASFGSGSGNTYVAPDFVYSAGVDLPVNHHIGLRLGYRGHLFEAPGFGVAQLKTGSITTLSEPFAGVSYHW